MSDQVCHIPTPATSAQVQQPQQSKLPTIPPAVDLPSALAAINQIRLILQLLTGQTPVQPPGVPVVPNSAVVPTSGHNPLNPLGPSVGRPKMSRFIENKQDRVVNKITLDSGDEFARVDQVVFTDSVTNELFVWKR